MKHYSEYVSLGHPDKVADYISEYLLDRYIEKDKNVLYAVEVQIKGHVVTLAGEVSTSKPLSKEEVEKAVKDAVNQIGYNAEYYKKWGKENTICGDLLQVHNYIGLQSQEIAQGVITNHGWGDQGIFFGYATPNEQTFYTPMDHHLAKNLCHMLYHSGLGGLDIKTQVVTDDDKIGKIIVAIPLLKAGDTKMIKDYVHDCFADGDYELIVNGTGAYKQHASVADCGTTGRKLAVDFYGGNCRIGGGSPWTKDGSKADLTLNLHARFMAKQIAKLYGCDVMVQLSCCIGRDDVDVSVLEDGCERRRIKTQRYSPKELTQRYNLDKPIYASMCKWGLFGEFQQDKEWEKLIL